MYETALIKCTCITSVVILMLYLMFKSADLKEWEAVEIVLCWLSFKKLSRAACVSEGGPFDESGFPCIFNAMVCRTRREREWRWGMVLFKRGHAARHQPEWHLLCVHASLRLFQPKVNIYEPEQCLYSCKNLLHKLQMWAISLHIFAFSWAAHQTGTWSSPPNLLKFDSRFEFFQSQWDCPLNGTKRHLHSFTYSSRFTVTFYKYCQILRL